MIVLNLKFDYENTGFSRTHYVGEYKEKKYNFVVIHEQYFDEICTATADGEPANPLKENITIILNKKIYTTKKINDTTSILKEIEIKDTITMQQWKKLHKDYKTIINGLHYILKNTENGTCLVPVKIIKGEK